MFQTGELFLRALTGLGGRKVIVLIAVTVPIGLMQGFVEIAFGFALLHFLSDYKLVPSPTGAIWLNRFDPIYLLLAVGALRVFLTWTAAVLSSFGYELFSVRLRDRLVGTLVIEPGSPTISVSDAAHLLTNVIPRSGVFISSIAQLLIGMIALVVTAIALANLSLKLSVLALLSFALFGLPVLFTRKIFQGYSAHVYSGLATFSSGLLKGIRNLEYLRIIGRSEHVRDVLIRTNREVLENHTRFTRWSTLNSTWPQFGAMAVVVVVIFANDRFQWLEFSILVPFVYLLNRAAANSSSVITAIGNAQFNLPFVRELVTAIKPSPSKLPETGVLPVWDPGESFSLEAISLDVGRLTPVIRDLSFRVDRGQAIVFTGASGRGKTTLLVTLIGLVPKLSGEILWNGKPISEMSSLAFMKNVAFSGPDPFLLDGTIRDNLLFGNEHLDLSEKDLWDALGAVCADFVTGFAGGLEHKLSEGGEGISAGQKQRLSLARAILRKPKVLILDEATANIDIELEAKIFSTIRQKLPTTMILAVSHRESLAKLADATMELS